MEKSVLEAVSPIVLIGCGYMGRQYLKILLEFGFAPSQIVVVDRALSAVEWCHANYPAVYATESLDLALATKVQTVFILTNTPEHAPILKKVLAQGVPNVFVEKPLAMPDDLPTLEPLWGKAKIGVGYLINFSGALGHLFEIIREQSLVVREGRGFWGKDRTGDPRPTAGDLEDEATHPLATLLAAVEFNQDIGDYRPCVMASLSRLPFVNEDAQHMANTQDASYPLKPTATSHLSVCIRGENGRDVFLNVHSSFVSFHQERRIELALSPRNSDRLTHLARLEFDVNKQDILSLRTAGGKVPEEQWAFRGDTKLVDQVQAFLRWSVGQEKDPRLADVSHGLRMIRLSMAALESDSVGEEIIS